MMKDVRFQKWTYQLSSSGDFFEDDLSTFVDVRQTAMPGSIRINAHDRPFLLERFLDIDRR